MEILVHGDQLLSTLPYFSCYGYGSFALLKMYNL